MFDFIDNEAIVDKGEEEEEFEDEQLGESIVRVSAKCYTEGR